MIFAVFDTNVLVSALITHNAESATVRVVRAIAEQKVIPVYNNEIILEYNDILHREKFKIEERVISLLLDLILQMGVSVTKIPSDEKFVDADDAVFYEVALSKSGTYLVTGNIKHFPKSPIVVTPAEMLQILQE